MGFLPSIDIDLSKLNRQELESLQRLLEGEGTKAKVRLIHIDTLLKKVAEQITKCD